MDNPGRRFLTEQYARKCLPFEDIRPMCPKCSGGDPRRKYVTSLHDYIEDGQLVSTGSLGMVVEHFIMTCTQCGYQWRQRMP